MMLRWMLSNLIRQAAHRKMSEAVANAVRGVSEGDRQRPADVELPPCEVAVLFGTNLESEDFARRLENRVTTRCATFVEHAGSVTGRGVVVAETGIGRKASGHATDDLIAIHRPAWVVCAGFASALRPDLRRGHILMAEHIGDTQGNDLAVGFHIERDVVEANRHLHVGRLVTVDELLRTREAKAELGERFDASAADMESMGVAQSCRREKIRFLSVRIITDLLDDRIPVEVERMISKATWASKLGAATGAMIKRPSSIKDWWYLQQQGLQASERLAKFLVGVLPQLTGGHGLRRSDRPADGRE